MDAREEDIIKLCDEAVKLKFEIKPVAIPLTLDDGLRLSFIC